MIAITQPGLVSLDSEPTLPNYENRNLAEEIFETWVQTLREKLQDTQKSPFHIERDIFVIMLRHFAQFKSKDVAKIPLLGLNQHNVDVISHRIFRAV